jgi:hypothetical protein
LPCFANTKPLLEAGNNYLGSECDHLPEAGNNIYRYPSISPYLGNVAKLIHRRRISLKRDNHPQKKNIGEEFDIGILARRLTLAYWSTKGDWSLAALELDVVKRDNTNYDPT